MTTLLPQEKRLIDLVTAERDRQCAEAKKTANENVAGLQRDARGEGRERVHAAVLRERDRARSRLQLASAELETCKRLHAQRRAKALIDQGWLLLKEKLIERWRDHNERKRWIAYAARQALRRLPANRWRIAHPRDWSDADQRLLSETLAAGLPTPPEFHADDSISVGLRVRSGGVVLDMSLEGMIADRASVESRLLALIDELGSLEEGEQDG